MMSQRINLPKHKAALFLVGVLLVLLAPAANAVTKHLSMIGEDGQPMANTTITITFPDGIKKEEEDTDDKGILMFDFSKGGVYTLSDPAGNVIKTVTIAGSDFNSKAVTITAVTAGALLLLAAGSSSSDSSSGDSGTDAPASPTVPETSPPANEGGGTEVSLGGNYDVSLAVASNPGDHPVLLQQLVLSLQIIGTALTIIQLSGNPNFPTQLSGTISNGSFSASASGVYSGFPTLFQLVGTIAVLQNLNFLLTVGGNGSLPGGQPIAYNAIGTKQ